MSLIKAAEAETLLRPLGPALPEGGMAPRQPIIDRVPLLETRITELEQELASLRDDLPGQLKAAREQGLKAGLQERDERSAERLNLLGEAMAQARSSWDARLASAGQLAVLIAKGALAKFIGNPEWRKELVVGAIERRIAQLDNEAIVSIHVSGADFNAAEIAALAATSATRIEVDRKLPSGECRVDLRMGHEELGVHAQWSRLAQLLDELTEAAC